MKDSRKDNAKKMFDSIDYEIKENLEFALEWAKDFLRDREGAGHEFHLTWHTDGIRCSFAKLEWGGDHTGSPEQLGSEAIVRAVCEYVSGL